MKRVVALAKTRFFCCIDVMNILKQVAVAFSEIGCVVKLPKITVTSMFGSFL